MARPRPGTPGRLGMATSVDGAKAVDVEAPNLISGAVS